MNDYGRDVRNARYAREWTREELAQESGITTEEVDAIENGDADPTPVMRALQIAPMTVLTTEALANFTGIVHPLLMKMPQARMHLVLAQILDAVARAAAGVDPAPHVGQVTLIAGDVISPDPDQQIG